MVLGTPGLVDPNTGDLAFAFDLPRWQRGLLGALREDLAIPVSFENDVNLVAVAEAHSGAAQGVDDFVLLWVGRGVGLAIMLGGKLHRGYSGAAGEVGWIPVAGRPGAPRPVAPGQGRIPAARRRRRRARHRPRARLQGRHRRGRGRRGGARRAAPAERCWTRLASRLALGIAAVCVVLDPPLVVLAGEVNLAGGAALAQRVEHEVAAIAPVAPRVMVASGPAEPVVDGALRTALVAVRDEVFGSTVDEAAA